MKKYLRSLSRYFLIYMLGFAVFFLADTAVSVVYNALCERLPSIIPTYNAVTEKEALLALEVNLNLISGILALPVLTVLAVKYDNERYEYIISKTDGFYTLPEGAKLYAKRYAGADILSSLLVPIPITALVLISFPEEPTRLVAQAERLLNSFLTLSRAFTDKLGFSGGLILIMLISLLSRIPAGYMGIKRWRGLWLSETGGAEL